MNLLANLGNLFGFDGFILVAGVLAAALAVGLLVLAIYFVVRIHDRVRELEYRVKALEPGRDVAGSGRREETPHRS